MSSVPRLVLAGSLAAVLAGCASAPPPPPQPVDLTPPHRPRLDAKSQLETGRTTWR
jgi:type IV pilus biogenesis protein CpaD/CtpE